MAGDVSSVVDSSSDFAAVVSLAVADSDVGAVLETAADNWHDDLLCGARELTALIARAAANHA